MTMYQHYIKLAREFEAAAKREGDPRVKATLWERAATEYTHADTCRMITQVAYQQR